MTRKEHHDIMKELFRSICLDRDDPSFSSLQQYESSCGRPCGGLPAPGVPERNVVHQRDAQEVVPAKGRAGDLYHHYG